MNKPHIVTLHRPGDPHRYQIICMDCGQHGIVHMSVEPQRFGAVPDQHSEDPPEHPDDKRMREEDR